jgi:hypothetical protein
MPKPASANRDCLTVALIQKQRQAPLTTGSHLKPLESVNEAS